MLKHDGSVLIASRPSEGRDALRHSVGDNFNGTMSEANSVGTPPLEAGKFCDPKITAKGESRATVRLDVLKTLWFNTGTLCNLTCSNCYIESSPTNDSLVYLNHAEVAAYLDELPIIGQHVEEIAFTGGSDAIWLENSWFGVTESWR